MLVPVHLRCAHLLYEGRSYASPPPALPRLLAITRLRDPATGCEWDVAQTFATIAPYTLEEAYEVADAIERADTPALREELGDLLPRGVPQPHGRRSGPFRLQRRGRLDCRQDGKPPSALGEAADEGQSREARWEKLKAEEMPPRAPTARWTAWRWPCPPWMRAEKLQKRAACTGFDWPDTAGPAAKVEELQELAEAPTKPRGWKKRATCCSPPSTCCAPTAFPEDALRAANAKFERRFRAMETLAEGGFASLSLEQQEALWQRVKLSEKPERDPAGQRALRPCNPVPVWVARAFIGSTRTRSVQHACGAAILRG
jgi:ATP diphosphatase